MIGLDQVESITELADRDPWDFYERLRSRGPVVWDDDARAWLVVGFEECAYVERHEELFAEPTGTLPGAHRLTHPREFRLLSGQPHRVLHKFLSTLWAPREFERYREQLVRRVIDGRIAHFAAAGRADLWRDFAVMVPIAVVAELIGLGSDDDDQLRASKEWTEAVLRWRHTYGSVGEIVDDAIAASGRLDEVIMPVIARRRLEPADDLISRLWEVGTTVFADWNADDVLANVKPLFEAGSDTSANLISSTLHALLTSESIRHSVAGGAEPLVRLIEEVLRHHTVVQWRARTAVADVELGGVVIRAGDRVHPINAAANRDPARYERPAEFDLGRTGYFSHLAFNVGPRQCAGAPIARMEAYESVIALLSQLPDLRLDPDAEPPAYRGYVVRSYRPLHVLFSASPANASREED